MLPASFGELRNRDTSVMIEKFARVRGPVWCEFLDLNHTSEFVIPVSLVIPQFARDASGVGRRERVNRDARRLQEKSKLDVRKPQDVRARLGDAAQRLAVRARADASHLLARLPGLTQRRPLKLGPPPPPAH